MGLEITTRDQESHAFQSKPARCPRSLLLFKMWAFFLLSGRLKGFPEYQPHLTLISHTFNKILTGQTLEGWLETSNEVSEGQNGSWLRERGVTHPAYKVQKASVYKGSTDFHENPQFWDLPVESETLLREVYGPLKGSASGNDMVFK